MFVVDVALSTFNGERYVREQLNSILNQEGVVVNIYARDDKSTDDTAAILYEQSSYLKLVQIGQSNLGVTASFLNILKTIPTGNYVALSDQDDVWLPDKLRVAVENLKNFDIPAMYCSDVWIGDDTAKNTLTTSKLPGTRLPMNFFQNTAMGCTVVVNKEAHELLKRLPNTNMVMHDWFFLICIVSIGQVIFDNKPKMIYRIHEDQTVGLGKKIGIRHRLSLKTTHASLLQILQARIFLHENGYNLEENSSYNLIVELIRSGARKRLLILLDFQYCFRDNFLHEAIFRAKIFFVLRKHQNQYRDLI
jgi:glycosyltransferase involved in cell wall biosynthesis